jgi:hypothetical protein
VKAGERVVEPGSGSGVLTAALLAPGPDRLRAVDRLLEVAFAGPHTVRDALRGVIPGKVLGRLAPGLGFDPAAHPRTVPPTAWLELARG